MTPMPKNLQIYTLKRIISCYNNADEEDELHSLEWQEHVDPTLTLRENRHELSRKFSEYNWYSEEETPPKHEFLKNSVEIELKRYSYESGGRTYYYFKGQVPSAVDIERLPQKTTITLELPKKGEEGSELPPDIEEIFD